MPIEVWLAGRSDAVRISVGTSWGTGFAIAPHRVLTSLHAVGTLAEGRLALHDGTRVRTGSDDGRARVWDLPVVLTANRAPRTPCPRPPR
jgi:hypothetical protein